MILDIAESIFQVFLQIIYVVFVKGMLVLLNALYQVFNFFTGGNFINQMMGVSADGSFIIDWHSPLAIMFMTTLTVGVLLLIIMIGLSFTHNLLSTREEKQKSYFSNKLKYVFYFIGAVIFVPMAFLMLNAVTSILASVLGVSTSLRLDSTMVTNVKDNLIPMVNNLGDLDSLQINGFQVNAYLDELNKNIIAQNKVAVDAGDGALSNKLLIASDLIQKCKDGLLTLTSTKNELLALLNSLSPDKVDVAAGDKMGELMSAMDQVNNSFMNLYDSLTYINSKYETTMSPELRQSILGFTSSFTDTSNGLGLYFGSDALITKIINGKGSEVMGLANLRSYVIGYKDFDLVLQIYRLATGNDYSTDWRAVPRFVHVDTLVVGILASLISVIIIALYTIYVVKRVFIIAIYFVMSPIMIATGVKDDGYKASAFAKTLIVKFSSIMFITIGMQVAMLLTSGSYGLNQLINQWDTTRFNKMVANIVLIVGGLLAGYTTTGAISKMLGDDGSVMESIQDAMLLTRGMSLAAAPIMMVKDAGAAALSIASKHGSSMLPITKAQRASVYGSRSRQLQGLGIGQFEANQAAKSYRTFTKCRNSCLRKGGSK